MVSGEMLKKLLDEFVEKEALIKEEIQVVHDEIAQLEERLDGCRQRLGTIGADREKVLAMKGRYLEGNFATSTPAFVPQAQAPSPLSQAAAPPPPPAPEPTPVAFQPKPVLESPPSPRNTRSGLAAILGGRKSTSETAKAFPEPAQPPVFEQQPAPAPLASEPDNEPFYHEPKPVSEHVEAQADGSPWGFEEQPHQHEDAATQPAPGSQDEENSSGVIELESSGETEDDTVKSINDALRSLFR